MPSPTTREGSLNFKCNFWKHSYENLSSVLPHFNQGLSMFTLHLRCGQLSQLILHKHRKYAPGSLTALNLSKRVWRIFSNKSQKITLYSRLFCTNHLYLYKSFVYLYGFFERLQISPNIRETVYLQEPNACPLVAYYKLRDNFVHQSYV